MSDTVSNSENVEDVEDVLSSIKRLVSNTGSSEPKKNAHQAEATQEATGSPSDTSAKPTALLLTSALRVPPVSPEPSKALDTLRQSISETMEPEAAKLVDVELEEGEEIKTAASLHWIAPAKDDEYYEDEAAEEAAIVGKGPLETDAEELLTGDQSAEVLHLTPTTEESQNVSESEGADVADKGALDKVDPELELDGFEQDLEPEVPVTSGDEIDTSTLSADADLDPNEVEETTHFSREQSANAEELDWNLDHLGSEETGEASIAGSWGGQGEPVTHQDDEAEVWDEVVAAGRAPFSREGEDADVAGVATFVRSGREVTYTEVETSDFEALDAVPDAEMVDAIASDGSARENTNAAAEEDLLDEELLRELVAEIVREELTGVLGERITRNVRKLVRQEINRALAAQELD